MSPYSLKRYLIRWIPPVFLSWYQEWKNDVVVYQGDYATWQEAADSSSGYDSQLIVEKVAAALSQVKSGNAAFERDSVVFDDMELPFPLLAGLLRAATGRDGKLAVLDFGGSLGSTYFLCREYLSVLPYLKWYVVEQERFVHKGRDLFESEQLSFKFSMQECTAIETPDVILFSGVLQYIEHAFDFLQQAIDIRPEYIIVDRMVFSTLDHDKLCVQHVPARIYPASYPCWIFSESNFRQRMQGEYELIADFDGLGGSGIVKTRQGGLPFKYKGMIWKRR